jgi:environmental stress-induced protein Ves
VIERFDLREIPAQPWKNGAGLTREIARGGLDAANFDWRLSVADVDRDAPFSAFSGVDRCIVLLRGAGMRLASSDGSIDHHLTEPLAPFHFSGDLPLAATLAAGPSRDFNVMTRRGHLRADVVCHRREATLQEASITFALCTEGEWLVETGDGSQRLEPMQGLLCREPVARTRVWPAFAHATSSLLVVRLCRDRAS